jgi:quercetin dioxygenase-like cupin family protein
MPPAGFVLKQIAHTLPKGDQLEVRVRTSTIQPGAVGEWHTHATPPVVYVLEGTLSVEVKDGETMHTKAGEAAVEPVNTVIRGTNKGQIPVKLVIFQVSPPDVPFSHPAPSQ